MTVSNQTNKYQYTGNGVTTGFAFSNIFFALTDLVVTLYDTTAMAAVSPAPVLNGLATYDYTITATLNVDTGEYPSGTVVFNTAPPSNYRVTIERVVPQTQDVTLIDNSKFPANTVNGALDRLTILTQRAMQLIGQALYYPSSDPSTVSNVLPGYQTRASMFLAFDSSGNPVASPGPSATGQPISTFWATTIQLASALLSRVALGVPGLTDSNTFTGTTNDFTGSRTKVATRAIGDSGTDAASTAWVKTFGLRGYLSGLTGSTAGSSATMSIAAGIACDSTAASMMTLAAFSKTTSAWALGSAAGGLDTGSIANTTWYHFYLIQRVDTGVVDVTFSLNATTPALPTNYTLYRRIFSGLTNGSAQWIAFVQDGDLFQWSTVPAVYSATNPGTSAVTPTLIVPLGVKVIAKLNFETNWITSAGAAYVSDPAVSDQAPSVTATPLFSDSSIAAGTGYGVGNGQMECRTNGSSQIRYRLSLSGAADVVLIATLGWIDRRGRDS